MSHFNILHRIKPTLRICNGLRTLASPETFCTSTTTTAKTTSDETQTQTATLTTRFSRDGSRFYRVPKGNGEGSMEYPSVTTVLKGLWTAGLVGWAARVSAEQMEKDLKQQRSSGRLARVADDDRQFAAWAKKLKQRGSAAPNDIRDSAGRLGSACHLAIERLVRNEEFNVEDLLRQQLDDERSMFQAMNVMKGFAKWRDASSLLLYPEAEKTLWSHKYGYAGAADALGVDQSDDSLVLLDFKTSNGVFNSHALQVAAYAKAYEEMTGETVDKACIVHLRKESSSYTVYTVKDIDITFKAFRAALFLWNANREILFEPTGDSRAL